MGERLRYNLSPLRHTDRVSEVRRLSSAAAPQAQRQYEVVDLQIQGQGLF